MQTNLSPTGEKAFYLSPENVLGDQQMFSTDLQEWRKQSLFCPALLFSVSEVDLDSLVFAL